MSVRAIFSRIKEILLYICSGGEVAKVPSICVAYLPYICRAKVPPLSYSFLFFSKGFIIVDLLRLSA